MLGITEKQHSGWDDINDEIYFHRSEAYKREEVVMSTMKDYEECFIMFSTMTAIKKTLHKTDKQKKSKISQSFEMSCAVANFEVDNDSLRDRHPDIFKNQEFLFCPTNDLIKSMPYDFVDELEENKWTKLDKKWLKGVKKTLQQAQANSVKNVKLMRIIMKEDITGVDPNLINYNKDHIFQVTMDNEAESVFYVNSELLMEVIGEEEWMKGEFNCICNIASDRILTLTWGSKKKVSNRTQLSIGDDVIVSNHGTKWEHRAKIIQMTDDGIYVMVKWDTSLQKSYVLLKDCKKYDVDNTVQRKRKSTDFFEPSAKEGMIKEPVIRKYKPSDEPELCSGDNIVEKSKSVETSICAEDQVEICAQGQVDNRYFNPENASKQCAQGSIANLLHMLKYSQEELDLFWHLAQSDNVTLEKQFGECAPKKADVMEKCTWILRKQLKFVTSRMNLNKLTTLQLTLKMLKDVKFPVLLGISSTQTSYNHVVVIWNGIVIDYESKFTFPVTEESIRRICGVNTTFRRVSTGFGLFPPKEVRKQFNGVQKIDWGITEFYKRDGNTIRGYFL
jgi:hypothetical protein